MHWTRQFGSSGEDLPMRIAVDACEHVVVAGTTDGALVGDAPAHGYDAFVYALDVE